MIEKEMIVMVSDIHAPYHDEKSVQLTYDFVKATKPSKIILGGDIVDFYSVSSFDKNPERAYQLQQELDTTKKVIEGYIKASPNSEVIMLEGNHENRLPRWLKKNPEVHGLRVLRIPSLLGLKEMGIKYLQEYEHKGFLFTHGKYTNKYHAHKELDTGGTSGMSGHKHAIQVASKTDRRGTHGWWSIGHLSDVLMADFVSNPNWQQGFGVVTFIGKGKEKRFFAEAIHITDHKFVYGDKLYKR